LSKETNSVVLQSDNMMEWNKVHTIYQAVLWYVATIPLKIKNQLL